MPQELQGYQRIEHTKYFSEFVFHDFARSTLNAFKAEMESLAPVFSRAPYVRALFDFTKIQAMTPYASMVFSLRSQPDYNYSEWRIALLAGSNLMFTLLQNLTRQYQSQINMRKNIMRVFSNREEATHWLRQETPLGEDK